MIGWLNDEKQIEPHVPVCDKTEREDVTFSSSEFEWNAQTNEYRCPTGKALRSNWRPFKVPRTHISKADTIVCRSSQLDCAKCSMKNQCCPNTSIRKTAGSIHEDARDFARAIATTDAYDIHVKIERRSKSCSLISSAS